MSVYKPGDKIRYFRPRGGSCIAQIIPAEFVKYCENRVKIRIFTPTGEVIKTVGVDSIERAPKG